MINYIILMSMLMCANSYAATHDETFYRLHPGELQVAIELCPAKHPASISCEQLNRCAARVNVLMSELHYDRQGFGQHILRLQEDMDKLKLSFKTTYDQNEIQASIDKNNMQLNERLAIVKWLESPRG